MSPVDNASPPERGQSGPINVLMAIDDKWAPYAAATMSSVFRSATGTVQITLLTISLSEENKNKLRRILSSPQHDLRIVDVDPAMLEAFGSTAFWSKAVYVRLASENLVDLDRVIYLDADIIVRTPLDELFHHDLKGAAVAGVIDIPDRLLRLAPGLNWLNLPMGEHYLNSGVLLMDLSRLRSINFFRSAREWYRDHQNIVRLSDQCVINAVLENRKAQLHPRWNIRQLSMPNDQFASMFCSSLSGIFHFNVATKPWTDGCNPAIYQEWRKHLPEIGYAEADYKRAASKPDASFIKHMEDVERAFAQAKIKPKISIRRLFGEA
jgi:lipopolysaccharide biosynthesis glycosyltransferase